MWADDTTIYYVEETVNLAIDQLNKGLRWVLQLVSKQWTNAASQKERGHYFPQGDTDRAYRYGVIGRLTAKIGYQAETVRSDSRPDYSPG